ncbi:MAG: hypothetical protein K2H96_11160 [Muribaculaceae bacterium]|nr:hypothetical protein [Muribaculaceae bacterium]MDE6028567.1 hypothetical protein [Muribaculaceae bacterium]
MKIRCRYCRKEIEIDEKDYAPGDVVSIECERCGEENEVTIPVREESSDKKRKETKAKVVRTAAVISEPSEESIPIPPQENVLEESVEEKAAKERTQTRKRAASPKKATPSPQKENPQRETKEQKEEVKLKADHKREGKTNSTGKTNRKPIERKPPVYVEQRNHSSGVPTWILLLLGVIVIIGVIWGLRSCGSSGINGDEVAVSDSVSYIEEITPTYIYTDTVAVEEVFEDSAETIETNYAEEEDIPRISVPTASNYTASQAYEIYPQYIPDERLGDEWNESEAVQRAKANGEIECVVRGDGSIEDYSFSIVGVRLKNGRLLGRYTNNTNGVRLDMNGVFDSDDNLIIRLGHKSETSYFVFDNLGSNNDGTTDYEGSWGKADKWSNLNLRHIYR